jgi:creatinine deaminase
MPCYLWAVAVVQFGIKKVIAGKSVTFAGAREFMESHGVEAVDLKLEQCQQMIRDFIRCKQDLWSEDIGTS